MLHLQYILFRPNQWYIIVNPSCTALTLASFLTSYRIINHYYSLTSLSFNCLLKAGSEISYKEGSMDSQIFGPRCFRDLLALTVEAICQMYPPRAAARVAWEWAWLNESKQLIEIDRNSTPMQPMHELAYFKNVYIINLKFNFYTMVRLLTYRSYRLLLLILCYVKHSVASKLFFQLHPRYQLHIGNDYTLNCSKLISMD